MEISGSHRLELPYASPCTRLHGHNWIVTVYCAAPQLDPQGMVCDFSLIKQQIHGFLDHGNLNELLPGLNPTAENIACWICQQVPQAYKVAVQESEGNCAVYVRDDMGALCPGLPL